MVLFYLSALREIGINEAPYKEIVKMFSDNRMEVMNVPRDLTTKNDLLIHDKEKRSFSSSQSLTSKTLLASLVNYKFSDNDITEKIRDILPLMKTIIKENPEGRIDKSQFRQKCSEKGIVINIPRDIPRIFGFFYKEYFYFFPWAFDNALKLTNTK